MKNKKAGIIPLLLFQLSADAGVESFDLLVAFKTSHYSSAVSSSFCESFDVSYKVFRSHATEEYKLSDFDPIRMATQDSDF
jgi:hypothetical protein